MTGKIDTAAFNQELDRRLDEVIAWVITECPSENITVTYADFAQARNYFHQVASGNLTASNPSSAAESEPEPEEGGPQYINDNPAPWP